MAKTPTPEPTNLDYWDQIAGDLWRDGNNPICIDRSELRAFLGEIRRLRGYLEKAHTEQGVLNKRIHDLKEELAPIRTRLSQLFTWLGVDEADEKAVRTVVEDLKALMRFKQRQEGGKLRSGESHASNTLAHYEEKLADKRRQIRRLERQNAELRAQRSEAVDA